MRVSAVSYLNTWPLVWGFKNGPQTGLFDFRFDLPAGCAEALENGEADIGLVPCAELDRLDLDFFPELGIACEGPVRSILLISKCPFNQIRSLAADSGSRTSVALARIILDQRYGCRPEIIPQIPCLDDMLTLCDAALIIGDPALHLEPASLPWRTMDLGAEWCDWTGLPMVFAVWAGKKDCLTTPAASAFMDSYRWGKEHIEEIVCQAEAERGFQPKLTWEYLTRHIIYELSDKHLKGLALYRNLLRDPRLLPANLIR